MNLCISILFVLIPFVFQQTEPAEIFWSNDMKITWADFKGKVDENDSFKARSCIGIIQKENYKYKGSVLTATIVVKASFDQSCSWALADVKGNDALLSHEQGHFDISEIYARKLRKSLKELALAKREISEINISKIIDTYTAERDAKDALYDTETNHSQDAATQKEWSIKIRNELKGLEQFNDASPIILTTQ